MATNLTRESVQKNSLVLARESAGRFAAHKQLAQKFIKSFEKRGGEVDAKFGWRKYKGLLQQAANFHIETIFVDLNDVEEFCQKEIQSPDQQIVEALSVPKIQLQQAIEQMLDDIEENTFRYAKYFYEACDAEVPERNANFNAESTALARDAVQQWRERQLAQQSGGAGGAAAAVPMKLKNNFDIRFKPRNAARTMKLREISASKVGSLVTLDCLVVRVSQVKPKVEVVTYHCEICGAEIFQTVESERYTPPKECPSQRCRDNRQSGKLRCNIRTCKFARYQEMRVQEMSSHVPVGGVPRSINIVLSGDLTRTLLPGDAITLTGVYTPYSLPWFLQRAKGTTQEMYIDAHSIKKHKSGYNEENQDEQEVQRKLDEIQSRGVDLYESAARSIAPEIFGLLDVKKALLLVLIGSYKKTMKDGMKIRGDIHTLLMGDPGVAKSQLLKQVVSIAPRSVYTTGKGSSGVGLTASVVRDNMTGEVSLEGGALVLADMGVCCIDEFDKMEESDRTAIHEVMEQQSVSIAKAGITTTLNCRTTILAGANPVFGRYNPYKSPVENIDLPAALLSRFDLLFLLLDTVDNDKDKMLALHVCKVHSSYDKQEAKADDTGKGEEPPADDDADVLNLGFKPFNGHFLRSYIRKAKTFEPLIDDRLQKDIVDAYVSMRDDEKRGDIDSRKSYTTPRTLLAILRLSQACARARFSDRVERRDFDEAMRLMRASKESVELSAPARKGANPLDLVYDIIADLSRRSDNDGWVELAHVVSMAGHKALTAENVTEAVENWESLSVICLNPQKTMVRFLVPAA